MNKKKLQKPPRKYDQLYNTILTPDQEKVYQNWVNSLPINLRGDYDYDLRGAWLNGDVPSNNYHFTDKWKKPWHPTFSNESVYSTPGAEGGRWDGEEFHPSNLNRFMQGFKYGEWGTNSFAKGGSYDGPPINWDYFISKMNDKSRKYNLDNLKYADNWLNKNGYTLPQRQAIIYNMWQESGGDPDAVSEDGRFAGLLQWDTAPGNRYSKIKDKSLDGQLQYIYDTTYGNMAFNGQNWMGMTRDETRANQAKFKNAKTVGEAMDIFTNGYVRPNKEVRVNRMRNYKHYFPEDNNTPLVTKPWARFGSGAGANFASGGPKKTYTAEQLTAMVNASKQAELQSMSPMSKTYTGPKIIQDDLTKKSIPSALQHSNVQTTLQNEEKTKSPNIPTIIAAKEPWQYQSYNTLPNIEGWNHEAENLGYALGAGHPMGINELNRYTLNTANLAGWVAAPEIMGLGESGYYFATKRPLNAALTWILGRFRPVANHIKNIKTNMAFNKSEFPQQVINDVQNAVNNDAKRYVERQLNEGNFAVREEFARQMQPKVKYDPSLTSWIKYNKNPFDWVKYGGLNVQGGQKIVMNPLALAYDPMAYKGLVAHEAKHSFKYLGMPDVAVETEKYFGPNKEFPLYDLIQPFEKASEKGLWRGSPDELLSEMANWKYQNNVLTTPYYMLDNETKNKLIKYASREFKINRLQTSNMLDGLSRFGLFKDGGSIHIKPENRGKFTVAAQRAGKSVQEYARQILANKDHYSSTLVKRANFARNFGGKK